MKLELSMVVMGWAVAIAVGGCGGETLVEADGGRIDASTGEGGAHDAGAEDAGVTDGGEDGGTTDAGEPDGGVTDAGSLPLTERVDDGTVVLSHTILGCVPAAAIAPDGTIYIAHTNDTVPGEGVRVARLEDGAWVGLGGVLDEGSVTSAICPSLVVTSEGVPYVAFGAEDATALHLRVLRHDGDDWEPVLEIDRDRSVDALFARAQLALDPVVDLPVLVAVERLAAGPSGREDYATVRRFDGTEFVSDGAPIFPHVSNLVATVDPSGAVVVLLHESSGFASNLRVAVLADGEWTSLPPTDSVPSTAFAMDLREVDARDGGIWVSWDRSNPAMAAEPNVRTAIFADEEWTEVDATTTVGAQPSTALGASGATQVYRAELAAVPRIRTTDGAGFDAPIDLPITTTGMVVHDVGGQLYVAYMTGAAAEMIRVNLP